MNRNLSKIYKNFSISKMLDFDWLALQRHLAGIDMKTQLFWLVDHKIIIHWNVKGHWKG